jgi:hypothetical protein
MQMVATTLTSTLDFSPLPSRKGDSHHVNIACNFHNMDICNFLSRIYPCEPFWKYIQIDTLLGSNHVNFSHIHMVNASNQELSFNQCSLDMKIWRITQVIYMEYFSKFYNIRICIVKDYEYNWPDAHVLVDTHFSVFKLTLITWYVQRLGIYTQLLELDFPLEYTQHDKSHPYCGWAPQVTSPWIKDKIVSSKWSANANNHSSFLILETTIFF